MYTTYMNKKVDFIKKNKIKAYTLTEIRDLKLIPWARNGRTIRKVIAADSMNLLKAKVIGVGSQRRYIVPANGLIKYLQTYGPVMIGMVRKTKNVNRSKRNEG